MGALEPKNEGRPKQLCWETGAAADVAAALLCMPLTGGAGTDFLLRAVLVFVVLAIAPDASPNVGGESGGEFFLEPARLPRWRFGGGDCPAVNSSASENASCSEENGSERFRRPTAVVISCASGGAIP
jgi:hypothetical protein